MLEKIYTYSKSNEKTIEIVVDDDPLMLNHIILPKGAALPEHYSNSNVYLVVVNGTLSLQLEDQDPRHYENGRIVNIPYHIKMNINNTNEEILEFFVVKSPNPRNYQEGK